MYPFHNEHSFPNIDFDKLRDAKDAKSYEKFLDDTEAWATDLGSIKSSDGETLSHFHNNTGAMKVRVNSNIKVEPKVEPRVEGKNSGSNLAPKIDPIRVGGSIVAEHGEDVPSKKGKVNGVEYTELTKEGREQAENLAKYLLENGIKKVTVSPIGRVEETVDIIKKVYGKKPLDIKVENELRTWDKGDYVGKPDETFDKDYWIINHPDEKVTGGESFFDVLDRADKAYEEIKPDKDTTKAFLTSSTMMKIFKTFDHLGKSPLEKWKANPKEAGEYYMNIKEHNQSPDKKEVSTEDAEKKARECGQDLTDFSADL